MSTIRTLRSGWKQISNKARWILLIYMCALVLISGLDGIALFLFSKLGLNIAGELTSDYPSGNLILGIWCIVLFLIRSATALGITWVGCIILAHEETAIGQRNLHTYFNMEWKTRLSEKVSGIYDFVDRGPNSLVQQYILSFATLIAEIFSSLVIFGVILSLNTITALSGFLFFIFVALSQHKVISLSSRRAGLEIAENFTGTYNHLSDAFYLSKLLQITPSLSFSSIILLKRRGLSNARARAVFIESLPRYMMESVLVLGVIVVGVATLVTQGSSAIVPSLAIFALAAFRILPSINRIQGLILGLIGREPIAQMALRSFEVSKPKLIARTTEIQKDFILELKDVFFSYEHSGQPLLSDISFQFRRGLQYAIVGPSGSGKSTLMDICMGLLVPDSGSVSRFFLMQDKIAYSSQETFVVSASLAQNVALEWTDEVIDLECVKWALGLSSLEINDLKIQVNQNSLSGGEKQRLGIARALYRKPTLLFLDEPTSALDTDTELDVMKSINELRGKTTVLIASHKLSTIKHADVIIYIENGAIKGSGSLTEVQALMPDFDEHI